MTLSPVTGALARLKDAAGPAAKAALRAIVDQVAAHPRFATVVALAVIAALGVVALV